MIFAFLYELHKFYLWATGKSRWLQNNYKSCDKSSNSSLEEANSNCIFQVFDEDFAYSVQPLVKYYCATSIVVSILICILSYKWRSLTSLLYYLVLMYQNVAAFIPSDQFETRQTFYIFIMHLVCFIGYYTDSGPQIIFTVISYIFMTLVPEVLLYTQKLTLDKLFEFVFFALALLLLISTVAIMARYIS